MKNDVILAMDCSLRFTAAAVVRGDENGKVLSLASEGEDLGRRQAVELPLMAERLIRKADITWADVGMVAVTVGPGYFTGLRVGAAYGMALAYGLGVKVVPVSSLEMLAAGGADLEKQSVLSVVYARRGAVYASSFGLASPPLLPGEYEGPALEAWIRGSEGSRKSFVVVSDDPERASESAGSVFSVFPIRAVRPDAAVVAGLAWRDRALAVEPMALRMDYHRRAV